MVHQSNGRVFHSYELKAHGMNANPMQDFQGKCHKCHQINENIRIQKKTSVLLLQKQGI